MNTSQIADRSRASSRRILSVLASFLLLLVMGCGSPSNGTPNQFGSGKLGEPCQQTEDCESGICVRAGGAGGICSVTCVTGVECPGADNWGCLAASNSALHVCACRSFGAYEVCGDGLDNDCDAKVDDCRTCNGVPVLNDDPQNCGACGNACRYDQECQDQDCLCSEGLSDCGNRCVDTTSSVSDCGVCGHACLAGETCSAGVCGCPVVGDSSCPGVGCVALDTDVNNCGSCGSGCTLGQTCADGACACPSAAAPDFCQGTGCVTLQADAQNCGACGVACAAGMVCNQGECSCPAGTKSCDGACVDLQLDEANCGECGQACGLQQACIQGSCGCNTGGYTVCDADCFNLTSDAAHCGTCDNACAAGEVCSSGSCSCQSQLYCDGVCMDAADASNCGECGKACAAGQLCSNAVCACQGFGLSPCGAVCVDFKADETNCGGCGVSCRSGEQCYSGVCQCPSGQTYCEAAGTCVSLNSDPQNCGGCASACDPTEICSVGTCKCAASGALYCASQSACVDTQKNVQHCGGCDVSCKPTEACSGGVCGCATYGQIYCASTDACTDTRSNTAHCGACDKACRTGEICSSGQCRCPGTQQYCATAQSCVDFTSDSKNCGACDNQCAAGQHCAASKCVCDQAGLTACGGSCYDLQTDEAHCGSCVNACGGTFTCNAGSCKCPNPTPGTEVRLMTDSNENYQVSAAWDGTNVGVAYVVTADASLGAGYNLYFARIKPDGTLVGTLQVTSFASTIQGLYEPPQLIWNGTEYGLIWVQNTDYPGALPMVMFRRINANGTFAAPAVKIAETYFVEEGGYYYMFRVQNAALAWSSQYGGYAVHYTREGNTGESVFQRLGATGTTPQPENAFLELSRAPPTRMAVAPDGSWGIMGQLNLQIINPDGSRTTSTTSVDVGMDYFYNPPLIHDGQTFVTVGRHRVGTTSNSGLYLNRGTSTNAPALLLQEATSTQPYVEALLAKVGASIAVGYGRFAGTGHARLGLQRYAIPATLTSAVTPLHDPIDIMTTDTVSSSGGDAAIVGTTAGHMLAVWADTRWGDKQLYARDIDLHACP